MTTPSTPSGSIDNDASPSAGSGGPRSSSTWVNTLELLSSMRFSISLLVFICMASLIGTVVAQGRSANAYIDQF
ncbi:MAG: cytochrome c biogenesis protein ResB, partial [Alcaligenaceae bacterium]